ncbi:MAG: glycogen debranching N-terminal domain-containing protein [Calditrichia bacterium]
MKKKEKQDLIEQIKQVHTNLSKKEQIQRKIEVLTQSTSSVTSSIAEAVVIKNDNLFFLSQRNGAVPLPGNHALGLYYHDCRYLNGYQIKLADQHPEPLISTAEDGYEAVFELTFSGMVTREGHHLSSEDLGVKLVRTVHGETLGLYDFISFRNFTHKEVTFQTAVSFQSSFDDVYTIRGLTQKFMEEKSWSATWKNNTVCFEYIGKDDVNRRLEICFDPEPKTMDELTVYFDIHLKPQETRNLQIDFFISEHPVSEKISTPSYSRQEIEKVREELAESNREWMNSNMKIDSNSLFLNKVVERSLNDLFVLRSHLDGEHYYAAGVPWFVTLFGRDSLITALQTLAFNPDIAAQTLRVLSRFQGKKEDGWTEEEPGKILHELRAGEMARSGQIPHIPYYGTVDATPLFLILMGYHAEWTGSMELFKELKDNVTAALKWIDEYGDKNKDGYIDYDSPKNGGLINKVWKDSGNAIVNEKGEIAEPPITTIETQAYVYLAKTLISNLFRRNGDEQIANRLQEEAADLKKRFNSDFWLADSGFYAMGLQGNGKPLRVVSSNPGHALWCRIADEEKAEKTYNRLMAKDMFTGWGIRTLSSKEKSYNPVSYHLGSVWPHDNSIIGAGFRNYGFDDAAHQIFKGLIEAAVYYHHYRLPELFCGFQREEFSVPVRYPVACHPQAWGAGTIPYLIQVKLGLNPMAFEKKLKIIKPILPDPVESLTISGLKVGDARADILFQKWKPQKECVDVRIKKVEGDLEIMVEQ